MSEESMDVALLKEFQANDEWDECFTAIENWDQEQALIAKSNAIDDDSPRREYLQVLNRVFGHVSFRPMQWKIINSVLNERRDNCAIMATGYGKSLCFQYPSVYVGSITIVVSPLIALMEDQVLSLTMSNISACLLGTAQTKKKLVVQEIFENKYNLIYVTPEFCCGEYGLNLLTRINQELSIILIAIDEAHCVSSWGHDFRFQYRELGKLREILPEVPILAVTATATPKVRSDIISCLKLRNPQVLCSGFDRPNLQFFVHLKTGMALDFQRVITEKNGTWGFPGSTIVYCITRKQSEDIAKFFQQKGIKCLSYHAGMSLADRKAAHEKFVKDKIKLIVATIAFGMGIDKPDVRNIIHYGASKDLESYYQEVGRAGRDGQPSNCITFYSNADFDLHDKIQELGGTNNTNRTRRDTMQKIMLQYLQSRDCRRQFVLNHFEGSISPKKPKSKCCDNCNRKLYQMSDSNKYEGIDENGCYDFTSDAKTFLLAVNAMGGKFGIGMYILLLRGSKSSKLYSNYLHHPLHGSGKNRSEDWWKAIGKIMERESYLTKVSTVKKKQAYNTYKLSSKGQTFLNKANVTKILLQPPPEIFKLLKIKNEPVVLEDKLIEDSKPSTSKASTSVTNIKNMSKTSKPSLRLLKVSPKQKNNSPVLTLNISDNVSETGSETDLEVEEKMKIYRMLMNKRTELAATMDCMPYMIASNEALMKMAQVKPITIEELRKATLDGFTEFKISKYGEHFVRAIRSACQLDPNETIVQKERPIKDLLAEYPLPGVKINSTALVSFSIYESGLTVQEIATKRGVVPETILAHLIDSIKVGYPVKMIDLNVTDEIRDEIIKVIRNPPINSDMSKLTPIKNACPPEITLNAIKIVVAYLQVRDHLKKHNLHFEEFEDPLLDEDVDTSNICISQVSDNLEMKKCSDVVRRLLDDSVSSSCESPVSTAKVRSSSSLSTNKKNKREVADDTDDSFSFDFKVKKKKYYISSSQETDKTPSIESPKILSGSSKKLSKQEREDFGFLDSPPNSPIIGNSKASNCDEISQEDLETMFCNDDFFDDVQPTDKKKTDITVVSSTVTSITENRSSELKNTQKSEFLVVSNRDSNVTKNCNVEVINQDIKKSEDLKNKFKKFNFKSRVPSSVEEFTKNLNFK